MQRPGREKVASNRGNLLRQIEMTRRRVLPMYEDATTFWMANVNYRVGAAVVLLLRAGSVSANALTLTGLALDVAGAVYLGLLKPPIVFPSMLVVLLIWQIGFSLDCADGPLARERGQNSPFGAFLDAAVDFVGHTFVFGSLAIFVIRALSLEPIGAALLACFIVTSNLWLLYASALRNTLVGATSHSPDTRAQPILRILRQGRQLIDYGAFLFIASILLLVPRGLFVLLLAFAGLCDLAVLAQIGINWRQHIHSARTAQDRDLIR